MSALSDLSLNRPDFSIESSFLGNGHSLIAGFDEAGRGALAGPLCVGMVIYDPGVISNPSEELLETIKDSKMLTHRRRLFAVEIVKRHALYFDSVFIPHSEIDRINVNRATELGVSKLIHRAPVNPDMLIMDGNFKFKFPVPFMPVIKGDQKSLSIASASVIAKVARDLIMAGLDDKFPGYGFSQHKGYGTKQHREAIGSIGPSPVHRRSYEPLKSMIPADESPF